MKSNRREVETRQMNIVEMVRDKGKVHVEELVGKFHISSMTARRDLQYLDRQNLLRRVHGGAVALDGTETQLSPAGMTARCREKIAIMAAGFVEDGDTLFINGSRTALALLQYTGDKQISVFTNNGWALDEKYPENVSVTLSGGEIHSHLMIGEYVVKNLLSRSADKTFLGCAAVYDDGEFRYDVPTEIGINEAMISRTKKQLYVLADHTKLQRRENRINSYGSCTYNRPVTLITDELADPEFTEQLRRCGIQVLQASVS